MVTQPNGGAQGSLHALHSDTIVTFSVHRTEGSVPVGAELPVSVKQQKTTKCFQNEWVLETEFQLGQKMEHYFSLGCAKKATQGSIVSLCESWVKRKRLEPWAPSIGGNFIDVSLLFLLPRLKNINILMYSHRNCVCEWRRALFPPCRQQTQWSHQAEGRKLTRSF